MVDLDHAVAARGPKTVGVRPRVLVEHTDPWEGLATALALREAGFAVATCPGPCPSSPCPLLAGAGCSLADQADVIVSRLEKSPDGGAIRWCLRQRLPGTPLLTDVEPELTVERAVAAIGRA